jgi:polyisoprenoid-binding protein YceI
MMKWKQHAAALVLGAAVTVIASVPAHGQAAATTRWTVAADGNEARYLVREQLAGFDFPNDAVGKTAAVTGALVLDANGSVVAGESKFVIDVSKLVSDQERRDGYVRRNTLATEEHPNVTFDITSVRGLANPLPRSGEFTFQLVGNLTVRDVTRPVTWDVTARLENGAVVGKAATKFTFEQFSMTKPRIARVLSVDDDIRLEYDFKLVPGK